MRETTKTLRLVVLAHSSGMVVVVHTMVLVAITSVFILFPHRSAVRLTFAMGIGRRGDCCRIDGAMACSWRLQRGGQRR